MSALEVAFASIPFVLAAVMIGAACAWLHNARLYGDENTIRIGSRFVLPLILGMMASFGLMDVLHADPETCGMTPDSIVLGYFAFVVPPLATFISFWFSK